MTRKIQAQTVEVLIQQSTALLEITKADLFSNRHAEPFIARATVMWIMRFHFEMSVGDIGRIFRKDASSVIKACNRITALRVREPSLATVCDKIMSAVRADLEFRSQP